MKLARAGARAGLARGSKNIVLGVDVEAVTTRIRSGKSLRRKLMPWGRMHVEREVPFLCVYRQPDDTLHAGTRHLVTSQACYLLAPGSLEHAREVTRLVRSVAGAIRQDFGACLILEIQMMRDVEEDSPLFRIVHDGDEASVSPRDALEAALSRVSIREFPSGVEVVERPRVAGRDVPLLGRRQEEDASLPHLLLEIRPIYHDSSQDQVFPLVQRRLRKAVARALQRAAFEFTREHTDHRPAHYHALGRRKFLKVVWEVDKRLANVSNSFDFLLLTTPRNIEEAWNAFRRSRFERAPRFSYRPLPFDPALVKRELYDIPIERIEDPTLADLFREQQDELDRKVTMIADRRTPRFKYASAQLFGDVDVATLSVANKLLEVIPSRARESAKGGRLGASAFAARAREEIAYLKEALPGISPRVEVRNDIAGLMVSRGHLLVAGNLAIPASRAEALIQHEVGTHMLTFYNGDAQPFRQLRNGLPAYEELQEGLAVLAEYLVGGLSRPRLRLIAARAFAVHRMLAGASFVEVFRHLDRDLDFSQRTAFNITMRVFRSGGPGQGRGLFAWAHGPVASSRPRRTHRAAVHRQDRPSAPSGHSGAPMA